MQLLFPSRSHGLRHFLSNLSPVPLSFDSDVASLDGGIPCSFTTSYSVPRNSRCHGEDRDSSEVVNGTRATLRRDALSPTSLLFHRATFVYNYILFAYSVGCAVLIRATTKSKMNHRLDDILV